MKNAFWATYGYQLHYCEWPLGENGLTNRLPVWYPLLLKTSVVYPPPSPSLSNLAFSLSPPFLPTTLPPPHHSSTPTPFSLSLAVSSEALALWKHWLLWLWLPPLLLLHLQRGWPWIFHPGVRKTEEWGWKRDTGKRSETGADGEGTSTDKQGGGMVEREKEMRRRRRNWRREKEEIKWMDWCSNRGRETPAV